MPYMDLEEPFHPDVTGVKCFHVFVEEANHDTHIKGLKIRQPAANATADYMNEMA